MRQAIVSSAPVRSQSSESPRAQQMKALLLEHQESGLSLAEFCFQRGLRLKALSWWKKRLCPSILESSEEVEQQQQQRLLPVRIVDSPCKSGMPEPAPAEPLVLLLRSGQRIQIPSAFDPDALARLVKLLEGSC
jgi:hypothetical protein